MFAGQGSQRVGMAQTLVGELPETKSLWEIADKISGLGVFKAASEGPEELLANTIYTQPALFVWGYGVGNEIVKRCRPTFLCGHSLGEYSALASAGVFSWQDALRIVRKRGELMFEAGLDEPGTMAAILGLKLEEVEELCKEASGEEIVVVANINCPGQIVISGHVEAVERAMKLAEEKGARRVVKLNVSGAFHSPLVAPAQEELVSYIKQFRINDSKIDVICNADAKPVRKKEEIVDALSRQLTSPVRWEESMRLLIEMWNGPVYEIGPGKVLAGLMKRIDRAYPVQTVGTAEEIFKIIAPEIEIG